MISSLALSLLVTMTVSASAAPIPGGLPPAMGKHAECAVGAYRSSQGDVVAMVPRNGGTRGLHYVFLDGRYGYTQDANPLAYCAGGIVYVKQTNGGIEAWKHVPLRVTRTHFESDGVTLSGMLIEPVTVDTKRPLVVHLHGSNNTGVIVDNALSHEPFLLAANGISSFLYDKHGTGESGGKFHMNFHRLAEDAAAASEEARRLAKGRFERLGLWGPSQGGWIGPLAANDSRADFVIVSFGGVFSPLEEDSGEVFNELREKGYGEDVLAKAREVTEATHAIRASDFQRGFAQLAAVKKKYGNEPWFKDIGGEFSGGYVRATEEELRTQAGTNSLEIPWEHDSVAVLRSLSLPILWLLAGEDRDSPAQLTTQRLSMLQKEGKPIDVGIFPGTDHMMWEFTQAPDGKRTYTRFTEGYYRLVIDWIHGRYSPPYGTVNYMRAKTK